MAHTNQIHFKQCRDVGRVAGTKKRGEMPAPQQGKKRAQAFLIGGCEDQPTSGPEKTAEFTKHGPWIFQMLDDFDGKDRVELTIQIGKRKILVGLNPPDFLWKIHWASHDVCADDRIGETHFVKSPRKCSGSRTEFQQTSKRFFLRCQTPCQGMAGLVASALASGRGEFSPILEVVSYGCH